MKKIINRFIGGTAQLEFGDYILFQEYKQDILKSYRKQNLMSSISSDEIDWNE
jgi:hypothetical protein